MWRIVVAQDGERLRTKLRRARWTPWARSTVTWNALHPGEAKDGHEAHVATILCTASETLRLVSVLLHPVLPECATELWRLGWKPRAHLGDALSWNELQLGAIVISGPPLFPQEVGQS